MSGRAPPLIIAGCNAWELGDDEIDRFITCYRLLLDAGADPTLCDTQPSDPYGPPFLHNIVGGLNVVRYKLYCSILF
jgi:hypothetical protein